MIKSFLRVTLIGLALLASSAHSALLTVDTYSMLNGDVGSYSYWDETYDGSGNVGISRSFLSGGTGDLTDGIIAATGWIAAEQGPPGAVLGDNGPYVGWVNLDPFITFTFANLVNITKVTFHVDNSINVGGVGGPRAFSLNGGSLVSNTSTRVNGGTAALSYNVNYTGTSFTTQIFRSASWVFVSEIQFEGTVVDVPAPSAFAYFTLALAGLFGLRKVRFKQ